jgi:hypothetical protein
VQQYEKSPATIEGRDIEQQRRIDSRAVLSQSIDLQARTDNGGHERPVGSDTIEDTEAKRQAIELAGVQPEPE